MKGSFSETGLYKKNYKNIIIIIIYRAINPKNNKPHQVWYHAVKIKTYFIAA